MLHLGDITKIDGTKVPAVEVIIGGSPCQNLSVAGNRKGLVGEQSQLFLEQIRIIKEMREKSARENGAVNAKPRYMVWENVPGAFSSNKGRDFKTVLEETIGVVTEVKPDIPIPKEGWHYSGCIMGEGFSLAWRVFDAQFWGVPQRRRRIALVADFGGESAPEILFERKGLSGNIAKSGKAWKDFAANLENRFGKSNKNNDVNGETVPTITGDHENRVTDYTALCVRERCGCEGGGKGVLIQNNKSGTLAANNDQFTVCIGNGQADQLKPSEKAGTLNCMHDQQAIITLDRAAFNQGENALYEPKISEDGINSTLTAKGPSAVCASFKSKAGAKAHGTGYEEEKAPTLSAGQHDISVVTQQSTVRRLTPLECERLQGFPDNWTNIGDYIDSKGKKRKTSDSARYKALGNSIALPNWLYVLSRLSHFCTDDLSMASLFDGIGGFPLIWESINGAGTCLWASEIDEFPMAVTRYHFNYD